MGIPRFEPEGATERDLRKIERAAHPWMCDLGLPEIGKSAGAIGFMLDDGR